MFQWDPKPPRLTPANTEYCRHGCPWWPGDRQAPQDDAERWIQALTRILYALQPLQRDERTAVLIHAALVASDEIPPPAIPPEAA
jgi:hypothetical protein